ncbi:hypothetical protein COB72_08215 [bacterium]|nr:MAG: hypothetical protein COB72_08215 [bacterium]
MPKIDEACGNTMLPVAIWLRMSQGESVSNPMNNPSAIGLSHWRKGIAARSTTPTAGASRKIAVGLQLHAPATMKAASMDRVLGLIGFSITTAKAPIPSRITPASLYANDPTSVSQGVHIINACAHKAGALESVLGM